MARRRYNIYFKSMFAEHGSFYASSTGGWWRTRRKVKRLNNETYSPPFTFGYFYMERDR